MNLLKQINEKEAALQAQEAQSIKESADLMAHYREKAHQKIVRMKQEGEAANQARLDAVKEELRELETQIDQRTKKAMAELEAQYEAHKSKAKQLLIEEVLSGGNR